MTFAGRFEPLLRPFLDQGVLSEADVFAVTLAAPRFGETDPVVLLGLAFAVRAPRVGHPAVELGRIALQVADARDLKRGALADDDAVDLQTATDEPIVALAWPEPAAWLETVLASSMVGEAKDTGRPFVRQILRAGTLEARTLLMTRRMFREQERVAAAISARAKATLEPEARVADLEARLAVLFGDDVDGEAANAVRIAAAHPLAVIIGGPGTGKTYSVSRLLAALLAPEVDALDGAEAPAPRAHLKVVLAAPTGKAAARMREALREATSVDARPVLAVSDAVRVLLNELPSETLHRLLGVRPDGSCRHHAANPMAADVVIVDEVSMVDLASMRRLLEAVPPTARLVLLGDRDQLASVEAGCVLADLVDGATTGALAARLQTFTVSRRFVGAPDIGLVAACLQSYETAHEDVPRGAGQEASRLRLAVEVMMGRVHASKEQGVRPAGDREPGPSPARIVHLGAAEAGPMGVARPTALQLNALARPYLEGYAAMLKPLRGLGGRWADALMEPATQLAILRQFERYRVLAVHRRGPLGVSGLERALADVVRRFVHGDGGEGRYWVGRPVLVTENAYDVKLMNGDVGLVLPTRDGLAAVFPSEDESGIRAVRVSRLPSHDGALAMTVHKSQGSQFDSIALVLAERSSPIQTRELVYTGVTRAKQTLTWLGSEKELAGALGVRVARASGLAQLLG